MNARITMRAGLAAIALAAALVACKQPDAEAPAKPPKAAQSAASSTAKPNTPAPAAAVMPAIPSLRITTVDGEEYDLAAHRGKWVVVNFWATWCPPCRKEMPELSALDAMREYIDVLGLAYEDIEPAAMKQFLRTYPVVYPVAIVDLYNPPQDFPTPRGLPMTYLLSPDGKVVRQFLGPVTASDIEGAIAAAGGPRPQT